MHTNLTWITIVFILIIWMCLTYLINKQRYRFFRHVKSGDIFIRKGSEMYRIVIIGVFEFSNEKSVYYRIEDDKDNAIHCINLNEFLHKFTSV